MQAFLRRHKYKLLLCAVATLCYEKWRDIALEEHGVRSTKQPVFLEQVCLHAIGALGCSAEMVKGIDQTMGMFINVFRRKTAQGNELISFDISRAVKDQVDRFNLEHNVEFSNVKQDVIYHSGFTKGKPWWQLLSRSRGALGDWVDEVKASSQFPDLVFKKLSDTYTAFQHLTNDVARSRGYWSHWNSTTFLDNGRSGSHHCSGIINMQLNSRGTVDVFLVYHESNIIVTKVRWAWGTPQQIPVSNKLSASDTVQDMCQWLVHAKMVNNSARAFPKLVNVNVGSG